MKKPSASLVVSTLALAVALTGTASATGLINGQSIRNHSITANKLALHSVTAKQIKAHAVTKASLAGDVTVDDPTTGPTGAAGPIGPAGPAGKDGTAKAFAYINPNEFVESSSGNVTISHPAVGTWCVTSPGTVAVVSIANSLAVPAGGSAYLTNPSHSLCDAGTFEVQTFSTSNVAADRGFDIIVA